MADVGANQGFSAQVNRGDERVSGVRVCDCGGFQSRIAVQACHSRPKSAQRRVDDYLAEVTTAVRKEDRKTVGIAYSVCEWFGLWLFHRLNTERKRSRGIHSYQLFMKVACVTNTAATGSGCHLRSVKSYCDAAESIGEDACFRGLSGPFPAIACGVRACIRKGKVAGVPCAPRVSDGMALPSPDTSATQLVQRASIVPCWFRG